MNTPAGFEPAFAVPPELAADAVCFVWRDDKILALAGEPPALPTLAELMRLSIDGARHYLGRLEGIDCIAIRVAADTPEPAGWQWRGLRTLFLQVSDPLLALAGRAFQIVEWDRSHQFCGRCGARLRDRAGERAKECPACGHVVYPRVSPAMMVLVTRGKELLLARANRFPQAMYSALAGFVEPGESIEDCIHREVREEVGVEVDRLQYVASQSWPFPHSLMIAYTAEYAGGEMRPCDEEIVEAGWFPIDALPQLPNPVSIARQLIDATVARLAAPSTSR
ncbi:MAG TPA: NAD(+) diphosphatase [Casimicrobiaceae bacterium]|jgi:NAD+ diphosphatase|nr:NAD(+) diphosphatase [Casimicrobiaceae bacterium]